MIHEFETFMIGGVYNNTINENIIDEENPDNYSQDDEKKNENDDNQCINEDIEEHSLSSHQKKSKYYNLYIY